MKAIHCHHNKSSLHFWLALLQLKGGFPKDMIAKTIEWRLKVILERVSLRQTNGCSKSGTNEWCEKGV